MIDEGFTSFIELAAAANLIVSSFWAYISRLTLSSLEDSARGFSVYLFMASSEIESFSSSIEGATTHSASEQLRNIGNKSEDVFEASRAEINQQFGFWFRIVRASSVGIFMYCIYLLWAIGYWNDVVVFGFSHPVSLFLLYIPFVGMMVVAFISYVMVSKRMTISHSLVYRECLAITQKLSEKYGKEADAILDGLRLYVNDPTFPNGVVRKSRGLESLPFTIFLILMLAIVLWLPKEL